MIEPTDETLRALLLGQLPEAQAQALADRVLSDEGFGLRLQALETDLIDDLARGQLNDSERVAAQRMLAATAGDRQRIRFARALAGQAARMSATASGRGGQSAHAASLRPRHRHRRMRHALFGAMVAAACAILIIAGLRQDTGDPTPTIPIAAHQATIALFAGQQRGTGIAAIDLPGDAASVLLQLEIDSLDALPPFSVRIEHAGQSIFEAHDLAARTLGPYRVVEVVVAADALQGRLLHLRLTSHNAIKQDWPIRIGHVPAD